MTTTFGVIEPACYLFLGAAIYCLLATARPMRSPGPESKVAFYLRYSSANQRADSIDDQRRNIMEYLDRQGIPYDGYIERSDRPFPA